MLKFDVRFKDSIPLLNLDNNLKWRKKINLLLEFFDAVDHLSETPVIIDQKNWIEDDLSIKNFLLDRIGDENVKKSVANCETTFEIWSKLKKFFDNKSSFDLFSKFDNFELQNNNLTESIKQFEKLYKETNSFINQSSNYLSYKLLNSLPSHYSDFISKVFCSDNLDYEQIKIELFNYEKNVINKTNIQNGNKELENQNNSNNNGMVNQNNTTNGSTINNSQQNEDTNINDNGKRNLYVTHYDCSLNKSKKTRTVYIDNKSSDTEIINSNQFQLLPNRQSTSGSASQLPNRQSTSGPTLQLEPQTQSQSHVQKLISAFVGPKSMDGSYSFCDYNPNFNLFDKKDLAKFDANHLKKLHYIGILDDKIVKSIKKFINLSDLQIQSTNSQRTKLKIIEFNYNHLNSFTFESNYDVKFKIKLVTKHLKLLSTNLKLNNLNLDKNQIKDLHLFCDLKVVTEIKEIENFKNIKTLQLSNKITTRLINYLKPLKDKLPCLNQIILTSLEVEKEELLEDLIQFSEQKTAPKKIYYLSIKLNKQVKIDLNKSQLYNQLNNYKYLCDESDQLDDIMDYNQLMEILSEMKINLSDDFFDKYDSVNCIKFTDLIKIENVDNCLNFLVKMRNVNKLEIRISRNDEPLFEKLIDKLKDKLVSLTIDINEELNLNINLILSLDKLSILKIYKILKNDELIQLTDVLKNLEFLEFKRQVNNEIKKFTIMENDDIDGNPKFCLYIDIEPNSIEIFTDTKLKMMIEFIIHNYQ